MAHKRSSPGAEVVVERWVENPRIANTCGCGADRATGLLTLSSCPLLVDVRKEKPKVARKSNGVSQK
jgi:hypothetical protein